MLVTTLIPVTLFLCGDVMTGRGIDQILAHPSDPTLHESFVKNANIYVQLAEQINGPIPKPVDNQYIWGEALNVFERIKPAAKIINLETTITTSNDFEKKGINYRMDPKNIGCLEAAKVDCCVLANNHCLDFGKLGLIETINTLKNAHIKITGAGVNKAQAKMPAIISLPDNPDHPDHPDHPDNADNADNADHQGRILIFAFGTPSSGVPKKWAATDNTPGVNFLEDFSSSTVQKISEQIKNIKKPNDIVILSLHWGSNWGYEVPKDHQQFAHQLIDNGVDIIYGHSSHHFKGIEVYKDKLILYGCGDFINDYEGIESYEMFRGDIVLMYFPTIELTTGKLLSLQLVPLQIKKFRLQKPISSDLIWFQKTINEISAPFKSKVIQKEDAFYLNFL